MRKLFTFMLVVLAGIYLQACGCEQIDTGHRGIKTEMGKVVGEPLGEGLYYYMPISSNIIEYSVRETKVNSKEEVFTSDTQLTTISLSLNYYPEPSKVGVLYTDIGTRSNLEDVVIQPILKGILKDIVGKVNAGEIISKREIITKEVKDKVALELSKRFVIVTGLQFTNIDFNDDYEQAVEAKVTATQLAEKAKNETTTIQEQAKQKIITSEADAKAMRIKSEALSQNKSLVEYEAVQKWNGVLPTYMMGNSVPFVNINK